MIKAIRWSGENDHYFGPFTYAKDTRYRPMAVMFGSGDGDDYPGCRIRLSAFGHTLIVALPPIIKPWRRWVDTSHYQWSKGPGSGYWEQHGREYGFSAFEGALHWHYGPQTHDSTTTKSKCWFYPWCEHSQIRHSLYDLDGDHFATLPDWGFRHKNGWEAKNALEAACPVAKFDFTDFDGEQITATCRIEEREWKRGKGIFRLLFLGRNRISRSLDLQFSSEVGRRKGSWKGGTIGHSIAMLPGELHEAAFRRYCQKQGLVFVSPVQAIEARSDKTAGLGPQGESAVAKGDAPQNGQ